MSKDLRERLEEARKRLLCIEGGLAGTLDCMHWVVTSRVSTMSTNGRALFINPNFCRRLSVGEIVGVLAHEAIHAKGRHCDPSRISGRDFNLWNEAADYVANHLTLRAGMTLPQGALINAELGQMKVEMAYEILKQRQQASEEFDSGDQPDSSQGGGLGDGGSGASSPQSSLEEQDAASEDSGASAAGEKGDGDEASPEEQDDHTTGAGADDDHKGDLMIDPGPGVPIEDTLEEGDQVIREPKFEGAEGEDLMGAASIASGLLPGASGSGISRLLMDEAAPGVSLHRVLQEYAKKGKRWGHKTWNRPSRRYIARGEYMPGRGKKREIRDVVVAVDVSGSMLCVQYLLPSIFAAAQEAFGKLDVQDIRLMAVDTKITMDRRVRSAEEIRRAVSDLKGGGGTSFDPPFLALKAEKAKPEVVVYVTDGYGSVSPTSNPGCPVVWLITSIESEFDPPFGRVVDWV